MHGLIAVYKKELSDHFSSYRFVILFALIAMVSFITSYMAAIHLRENLEGVAKPQFVFLMLFNTPGAMFSMVQFVAFFGPLIGLIMGFDTINRERAHGTLVKLLSQPIYRDAVINGKFLAGATNITIMLVSIVLVISGLGLNLLGVVPGGEEIMRLVIYVVISIFYISFWLGISILFSIVFRGIATSALASVALWIFLSFFVSLGASVLANTLAPVEKKEAASAEMVVRNANIQEGVSLFSPMALYSSASGTIIDPMRKTTRSLVLMGPLEEISSSRFQNPLSLGQSVLVVYPHMVALIAISLICFAISYTVFMVQEIRT
ncbi:MAG: ABC transporter permease [Deltaproteobacteria bacterium]|nr:ABC transporter permease [Deltaproteobacteria bacterium]